MNFNNTYYLDKCREKNSNSFCRPYLNNLPPLNINDSSIILKRHPDCQKLIIVEYDNYIIVYINDDIKYRLNIFYKNQLISILPYLPLIELVYITTDKNFGLQNLKLPNNTIKTLNLNYLANCPINIFSEINKLILKNYIHINDSNLLYYNRTIYILDIENAYFSSEEYLTEFIELLLKNPIEYIRLTNVYLNVNFVENRINLFFLENFYKKLENGFYRLKSNL
jgi:hypothetical protein